MVRKNFLQGMTSQHVHTSVSSVDSCVWQYKTLKRLIHGRILLDLLAFESPTRRYLSALNRKALNEAHVYHFTADLLYNEPRVFLLNNIQHMAEIRRNPEPSFEIRVHPYCSSREMI